MKQEKLLSILIPTYNREEYLMKNLNILLSQINEEIAEKIEIIISDNCSDDNTFEKLLELKEKNEILKISKNEKNIGADKNFYKLIMESQGKYLWLFGDDEFLLEKGLEKVIYYLEKEKNIGLFHIKNSSKKNFLIYEDKVKYMKKVNYKISFITGHIFNREMLEENIDYEEFLDSFLIQEMFYFQVIKNAAKNAVIVDKIFTTDRADNIGGYKLFEVFAINQNKILKYFEERGLDTRIREYINKLMCVDFFPEYILKYKMKIENKWKDENIEETLVNIIGEYREYKIFCKPLIRTTVEKAKIYYKISKKMKKIYKFVYC